VYAQAFRAETTETNAVYNYAGSTGGSMSDTVGSYTAINSSGSMMITGCYTVA
jgi:hypothetical protein